MGREIKGVTGLHLMLASLPPYRKLHHCTDNGLMLLHLALKGSEGNGCFSAGRVIRDVVQTDAAINPGMKSCLKTLCAEHANTDFVHATMSGMQFWQVCEKLCLQATPAGPSWTLGGA